MSLNLKVITFALTLAGFGAMAGTYQLGFEQWPPRAERADGTSLPFRPTDVQECFKSQIKSALNDRTAVAHWRACRATFAANGALSQFQFRSSIVIGSAFFGLLALFGFAFAVRFERAGFKIVRGGRYFSGAAGTRAFAKASAKECKTQGQGIEILQPHPISRERETRHFLILGSVGGGKTQTMLHMILEAIARDDAVLVLDTKGDMMAGLPGQPSPLLVAPHDSRSLVWDIASDCRVKQDARELAARFIPEGPSDPMWSQAAQEIFVACVVYLQVTKSTTWNWADLEAVVTSDLETLKEYARLYNPNALRLLDQPESRTTLSILTTFQTHMRIVSILAEAWPDNFRDRFSIREWLLRPQPRRPLILQHDPGYPELSRIWIGSMLGLLASSVGSPSFTESKDRRLWLFLDEFPQLPRIRQFPTFLELGRSKGVSVVIGAQDAAQIRSTYGADQERSWFGMIGTKIITRINTSIAAEDISRLIGDHDIERTVKSTTYGMGQRSVTESLHRESRRIIAASEIASRLGPGKTGVRILLVGLEDSVYELELPFITLPAFRDAISPADWTHACPSVICPGKTPERQAPKRPTLLTKEMAERIRQTVN